MCVLLLSNGAPGYHNFFNALLAEYTADGRKSVIAVDNPYSRDMNGLDALECPVYDFSSFFRAGQYDKEDMLQAYEKTNLNTALLSDFERSQVYGIPLARKSDFYTQLICALLAFFEDIFDRHNVNEVIYEGVSNSFAHFAYFVAIRKGAKYRGLISSRLPGRYAITSDPCEESGPIMEMLSDLRSGCFRPSDTVVRWCQEYLSRIESTTPDYMRFNKLDQTGIFSRYLTLSKFEKLKRAIRHSCNDHEMAFQLGNPLRYSFSMVRRNLLRRWRLKKVLALYGQASPSDVFYLYPLHFHPEASTSILAGTYLDEYEVVRNIAFNLPVGRKLYVKDHVSAYGFQSLDFYQRLKQLPNVVLLGPNEPTKELIKASKGVVTLTSTVGYEALLLNKRVFLYGRVFYERHKNVVRISDPTRLFETFISYSDDPEADEQYTLDFLVAYYSVTRPGTLNLMAPKEEAETLAHAIYKDIRDYP